MVVVGGVTRLTRSGLSIVEWNPVIGAVLPLTETHWQAEFEKYQRTPEYQKVNAGMALAAFKQIYYVEWTHRLLGRLIGLVFLVPLVYFAVRRRLSPELMRKLLGIFILGGLQGALGWFMVKSGLVDVPRVSPYRLTAHLALAVAIYGYILWVALDLLSRDVKRPAEPRLRRLGWAVTALVFLMILAGGFVAGTRAGFVFNTFPLMNGHFFPPGLYGMEPWWVNIFENVATVQFNHRLLAYVVLIAVLFYWQGGRNMGLPNPARTALHLLIGAVVAQITLGIATLLLAVPVSLGALHQAGALIVFSLAVYLNHVLGTGTRPTPGA
jgi:cytochrome c oxidase assembly protein subunit 15